MVNIGNLISNTVEAYKKNIMEGIVSLSVFFEHAPQYGNRRRHRQYPLHHCSRIPVSKLVGYNTACNVIAAWGDVTKNAHHDLGTPAVSMFAKSGALFSRRLPSSPVLKGNGSNNNSKACKSFIIANT